jgi:hypothetical protein
MDVEMGSYIYLYLKKQPHSHCQKQPLKNHDNAVQSNKEDGEKCKKIPSMIYLQTIEESGPYSVVLTRSQVATDLNVKNKPYITMETAYLVYRAAKCPVSLLVLL